MNKSLVAAAVFASLILSAVAHADRQTVSLGYAQSKVQDFKDIQGFNVKYRYEWDSPLSLIGSFTWMQKKDDLFGDQRFGSVNYSDSADVKYYSLTAGPAWRINEYVSLYALAGFGWSKVDVEQHYSTPGFSMTETSSETNSRFAYGAGIQINPVEYLAIDIGYQGGKIVEAETNGFNIGIGYSF